MAAVILQQGNSPSTITDSSWKVIKTDDSNLQSFTFKAFEDALKEIQESLKHKKEIQESLKHQAAWVPPPPSSFPLAQFPVSSIPKKEATAVGNDVAAAAGQPVAGVPNQARDSAFPNAGLKEFQEKALMNVSRGAVAAAAAPAIVISATAAPATAAAATAEMGLSLFSKAPKEVSKSTSYKSGSVPRFKDNQPQIRRNRDALESPRSHSPGRERARSRSRSRTRNKS